MSFFNVSRLLAPVILGGALSGCSSNAMRISPRGYGEFAGPKEICREYVTRSNNILQDTKTNLAYKSTNLFIETRSVVPYVRYQLPLSSTREEIDSRFALLKAVKTVDHTRQALPPDDPFHLYPFLSLLGALFGLAFVHTLHARFSEGSTRPTSRLLSSLERTLSDFFSKRDLLHREETMKFAEYDESTRRENASVLLVSAVAFFFMSAGAFIGAFKEKEDFSPQPSIDKTVCDSRADDQVKIQLTDDEK